MFTLTGTVVNDHSTKNYGESDIFSVKESNQNPIQAYQHHSFLKKRSRLSFPTNS